MLVHWIWLSTRHGLGDYNKKKLLERFGSPENLYAAGEGDLRDVPELTEKTRATLLDRDLRESEQILSRCGSQKIRILTYQDAAYPGRLKNIPDPPMVLYYKGTLPEFDSIPLIGVVGTRSASPYGLTAGKRLGYQIAACGGGVVSGLAAGVDAMAMKGALTAGGCVVGVLGCGADVIYPLCNRALFADMERYGCILTEFAPGTEPAGRNFPRRNRIISGLSCGVLVVEAPEKSGALITARLAADQGRDVFTVPANIDNPAGKGTNQLLKDGAIPVENGWDVMREYVHQYPDRVAKRTGGAQLQASAEEVRQAAEYAERKPLKVAQKPRKPAESQPPKKVETKKVIDKRENEPYIDLNEIESSLSEDERVIVRLLASGQKLVDDVIAESGKNAGTVLASLTLLEVKGIVRRLPGRYITLAGRN